MDSYHKLKETAKKASKGLTEALDQCEAIRKKCDKRGKRVEE